MSCRGKIGYFVEPREGWRLWSFDRRGRLCREGACLKIDVQSLHMGGVLCGTCRGCDCAGGELPG